MRSKTVLVATGLVLAFAPPAVAQQSSQQPSSSGSGSSGSSGQKPSTVPPSTMPGGPGGVSVRQHIQSDLEKLGYQNVRVRPTSFLAQATDSQNRPVLVLIDPESITVITDVGSAIPSGSGGGQGNQGGGQGGSRSNQGGGSTNNR